MKYKEETLELYQIDKNDISPLAAAIRETREECGFELHKHIKFQELEAQQAGGNVKSPMWVQPFYFELEEKPQINLDLREHSEYFWVAKDYLLDQQNHYQKRKSKYYPQTDFWCADICGNDLWGFTYKLMMDFLKAVK